MFLRLCYICGFLTDFERLYAYPVRPLKIDGLYSQYLSFIINQIMNNYTIIAADVIAMSNSNMLLIISRKFSYLFWKKLTVDLLKFYREMTPAQVVETSG